MSDKKDALERLNLGEDKRMGKWWFLREFTSENRRTTCDKK
jgi:hypothetical protein